MTQHSLSADKREILGKKVKQLRRAGKLPANIFGEVKESIAITLDSKEFTRVYKDAGDTGVIYISVGEDAKVKSGQARPILVDSVDIHPLTKEVLHVSLRQVDLKQKITAAIAVELVGELDVLEATTNLLHQEIEVEALPTDLLDAFEIDLSQFTEIGQEFKVSDLKFDRAKIEITLEGDEVLLQIQKVEEMAEVVEEEPAEVETTEQGVPEAEAGAEGEATPEASEKSE